MIADDELLRHAASAVLDGTPVDWDALARQLRPESTGVLRELQVLATLVDVHREPAVQLSAPSPHQAGPERQPVLFRWGPLDVLEPVGRGAFGSVYRAWERRLARVVALKLLDDDVAHSAVSGQVIEEGGLLARVHHPNVATIFGADRIEGRVGLWMEFVEGATLAAIVERDGPLVPHDVLAIGVDLCAALAAVHGEGLLHRDVKAQNVVRHPSGRVVLMDFGAGVDRQRGDDGTDRHPAGTPLYLAPEVLAGGPPSVQSDLYALGVLLHHLATGTYPVTATSIGGLRDAHRAGRRRPLSIGFDAPASALAAIIDRATAPDPAHRFASAAAMASALRQALERISNTPAGARVQRRRPRAFILVAAGLTLAVLVAMASVVAPGPMASAWRPFAALGGFRDGTDVDARSPLVDEASTAAVVAGTRHVPLPPVITIGAPARLTGELPYVGLDGRISVFEPATGVSRQVPLEAGRTWPESVAISPDAQRIAYTMCPESASCEVRLTTVDAAHTRALARLDTGEEPALVEWSLDGAHLLARIQRPGGALRLALIDVARGDVTSLHEFTESHPLGVSLSPDGRFVLFDAPPGAGRRARDIFLLAVADGAVRPLIEHPADDAQPLWTPDGSGVFFLSDRSGVLEGWLLDGLNNHDDGRLERVIETYGRAAPWVGFGPEGRLFYWRQMGTYDVYLADLEEPGRPRPVASRFSGSNRGPGWSPDGRHVSFVTMRYGGFEMEPGTRVITIYDTVTGSERILDPDLAIVPSPPVRWSPDGAWLFCNCFDRRRQPGTFVIDVASGRASLAVPGVVGWRSWSPDGRGIVYDDRVRGLVERDLASGEDRVLWPKGQQPVATLHRFAFAPDRQGIAFSGLRQSGQSATGRPEYESVVGIYEAGDEPRILLSDGAERLDLQDWMRDGHELIVARTPRGATEHTLWAVPAAGGALRPLDLTIVGNAMMNPAALSPNGRTLAFSQGNWTFDLWVYERFLPSREP